MNRLSFYLFLPFYLMALLYLAITLPIGSHEASIYYSGSGILYTLTHLFDGYLLNGLNFRLPFLLFGFLNIFLFYKMSRHYFDNISESYLATVIFALLPGIITSIILVNIAVIVISLVLFFLIFYEKKLYLGQALSIVMLLIVHDASVIFFISLTLFSAVKRDRLLFGISLTFTVISLLFFNGLEIGGRPSGKFIELFGLYMALFSPLVFLYFFYSLYRIWLRESKDILWYISFTAFVLSILLSLRQRVDMTDFAPYVIVAVVLMLLTYYRTLYVRLPQFQKFYRVGFYLVFSSLIFSAMVILFHQLFFYLIDDKSKHFAYKFYEPYWQVLELKEIGQNCYTVKNQKVQYQLKYYGIEKCEELDVPKIHR